jgi:hypothetical protein
VSSKTARRFTADEIARVVYLRDTEGLSFNDIAKALGRPGAWGCREHYVIAKREAAGMHTRPRSPRVALKCLRCRSVFLSADRRRNRLCSACNGDAIDSSPFEPDHDAPAPVATR